MNSAELAEKFGNELKDFVAEWIKDHAKEITDCKEEHSDRAVIMGGLSGVLGYMAASFALNEGWTKGQLLEFVEIAKRFVEATAEGSFDERKREQVEG